MQTYRPTTIVCVILFALLPVLVSCQQEAPVELVAMDIHISDDTIDFGLVPTGTTVQATIRVHNAGDAELVFSIEPTLVHDSENEAFALDAGWDVIAPRTHESLRISYSPVTEEDSYAHILLYTNDQDEANRVIVLKGSSFVGTPQVMVSPSLVEFGFVASGNTAEQYVEIHNTGDVDVEVVDVSVGGSQSPFQVASVPDQPIPPGSSALVPVQFVSEGGDHEIASLTVEIANAVNPYYSVTLSANSPGSSNNSPPQIDLLNPTVPTVFYLYQDLYILARVFDAQQPNIGLYCTLESNRLGMVEQETSDPTVSEVDFLIDVDDSDFEDELGLHTLSICCTDVFNVSSCETLVVSIDWALPQNDGDGDGYGEDTDCDDGDASRYPGALEIADNVDNDCDGVIDENTVNVDDDGDGLAEVDGDCNDADGTIHPGAAEEPDYYDNNCDGTIDEGTVNFDDDGDGFSEALGDCNDEDTEVYRDALEWCDDKDNDCDGEYDEDCIDDSCPLYLVGGMLVDRVVVDKGEEVNLSVTVIACDGAELSYEWEASDGAFTTLDGPDATWTAPDEIDEYDVWVQVIDWTHGQSQWAFIKVTVNYTTTGPINPGGCVTAGRPAGPSVPAAAVALLLVACARRRIRK